MPSDSESSPPRAVRPTPPPELPPRQPTVELSKFEPFPELEPFPFKPDPPRPEKKKLSGVSVRKPGKFVRGESRESDYESDLEGAKITPRWVPPGSDTDDTASYKKVQPKLASEERTLRAVSKEPTPPTQFEVPPEMEGPPRPKVLPFEPVLPIEQAAAKPEEILPALAGTWPRTSSSQPSAEALAMEKSWVPKRLEADCKTLPRMSSSATPPMKPSPKAIEMEKQWSHRFTSHSSKIWPPPPSDCELPPIPIWSGQQIETVQKSILKSSSPSVEGRHHRVQIQEDVVVTKAAPALKVTTKEVNFNQGCPSFIPIHITQ